MKFNSLRDALVDYLSETQVDSVEKISEALLDGHSIPDLGDLSFLTNCDKLGYLSLNKCDLKSLPMLPKGLNIERLELCDNKLSGGLEAITELASLEELHLGGNPLASLESLKPLANLKSLRILDITDCPVAKDAGAHSEIFKLIPTLEALSGKDESGESVDFEDGSSDLDDYDSNSGSDEDDEEGSDDGEDSQEDASDDDDEEDEDEEDEGEEEEARPAKSARHD